MTKSVGFVGFGGFGRFLRFTAVCVVLITVLTGLASAQSSPDTFQMGAQITTARSGQFESTELGIGGRVSWHPIALLGIESEIDWYPADFPGGSVPFSAARLEGLFGVTAGTRLGSVRPFAKIRAGFLRYSPAPEPFACLAIFPPPLNCLMATGGTRPILDIGGGLEVFSGERTFVRLDAGDRMVRYPGPSFAAGFTLRDGEFVGHDFRLSVGGGLRF